MTTCEKVRLKNAPEQNLCERCGKLVHASQVILITACDLDYLVCPTCSRELLDEDEGDKYGFDKQ